MSSVPRAWPGVAVPADYYAGEVLESPTPSWAPPVARPTFRARRHRPWLTCTLIGAGVAILVLWVLGDPVPLLRILSNLVFMILLQVSTQRAVAIEDVGSPLLLRRGSVSPEPGSEVYVTHDQIVRVRPERGNAVARRLRPEVWQVGPERIVVDSPQLHDLLVRHSEATPS